MVSLVPYGDYTRRIFGQTCEDTSARSSQQPSVWHLYLPLGKLCERISVKWTTGYPPYDVMFLAEPVLPVDLELESWSVVHWEKVGNKADLQAAQI